MKTTPWRKPNVVVQDDIGTTIQQAIAPHGGRLVDRALDADQAEKLRVDSADLPAIRLSPRQASDLKLLGNGAFSPLDGFLGQADYARVVAEMHLSSGLPWSIPV